MTAAFCLLGSILKAQVFLYVLNFDIVREDKY
jgi:hypothetical protein